jgi:hypothetical protein
MINGDPKHLRLCACSYAIRRLDDLDGSPGDLDEPARSCEAGQPHAAVTAGKPQLAPLTCVGPVQSGSLRDLQPDAQHADQLAIIALNGEQVQS